MGGPNYWEYSSPVSYGSPKPYTTPIDYAVPFEYGPPGGDGGGSQGGGGRGGGGGDSGRFGFGSGGGDGRIGWFVAFCYAALGVAGFVISGSTPSLLGGALLSAPFAGASLLSMASPKAGAALGLVSAVVVLQYCLEKFRKSRKIVPSGLLLVITSVASLSYGKAFVGTLF